MKLITPAHSQQPHLAKRCGMAGIAAVALCIAQTLALPALAAPEGPAAMYDDALQRLERNDLAGAAIQLKNALQQDKRMLAAHLLLGKVLIRANEYKAAEAALEEALRQGVSKAEVAIPLGQVYLQMGETRKFLDTFPTAGLPPGMHAEILTMRGTALAMSGSAPAALQAYAEARALDPKAAGPWMAEAPIFLRAGEPTKAKASATKATELAPDSAAAWYQLGTVLHTLGDPQGALTAFDKSLTLNAKHVDSRVSRAAVLVGLKRDEEAARELAQLKEWGVVEPRASFLRGTQAAQRGDAAAAKAEFSSAIGLIDAMPPGLRSGNEPLLMAAALSHRSLGNLEKAREYLETLIARNNKHYAGQLLLASILLDTREVNRAMPMLEYLHRITPDEPQVLYLLGSAYMAKRQFGPAAEAFERASARSSNNAALRELGFSQLGLGQDKIGLANLEKAWAKNPADYRAGVQLATLYMRQGESVKAVQTAQALVKVDPENLAMVNFLGNVKGRVRDTAGAREAFTKVLAKDPKFRPGIINLSWLDMEEGKLAEARERLGQHIKENANDGEVLFQLGALEQKAKNNTLALAHWKKSDELLRQDPRPGMSAVELMAEMRHNDQALAAAKVLAAKFPNAVGVQALLARTYATAGDAVGARLVLREATKLAGFDSSALVMLGRMLLSMADLDGATLATTKALQASPADIGAMVLKVELAARRGNVTEIDAAMTALAAKHPGKAQTLLTAGNIAVSRGKFPQAIAQYKTVMDREPNTPTALMLTHAYLGAKEADKALLMLEAWSGKNPADRTVLRALAEVQLLLGKNDAARKSYATVVAADPEDPAALNSYAQLLQRLNDPTAISVAEKAVKLAPNHPGYADTLGWMLVQQGDTEAGTRLLRDARLREPGNGQFRYHLVQALFKAGKKTEAKEELTAALSAGMPLPKGPEFNKLKTDLGL